MYDPDRDDPEWEEEIATRHHHHHSPQLDKSKSTQLGGTGRREIRPLPKRQRLTPPPSPPLHPVVTPLVVGTATKDSVVTDGTTEEEEECETPTRRRGAEDHLRPQASKEYRYDDGVVGGKSGRLRRPPPPPATCSSTDDDAEEDEAPKTPTSLEEEEEPVDTSPPTSPSLDEQHIKHLSHSSDTTRPLPSSPPPPARPTSTSDQLEPHQEQSEPDRFPLFQTVECTTLLESLSRASIFSSAGLCGGLGLAALHPSLGTSTRGGRSGFGSTMMEEEEGEEGLGEGEGDGEGEGEDGDFEDEDGYSRNKGNSNKKKRKIPGVGVGMGGGGGEDGGVERGFDNEVEEGENRSSIVPGRTSFGSDFVPIKAPVNPPTTAKAALAKLRTRPPHISIVPLTSSSRRYRRHHHRHHLLLQPPLHLPTLAIYSAPTIHRDGPPPLPPGSGLKGSKALKAAKKAEKDREREKERIRLLLGGPMLRLPDLWDPLGEEESKAGIRRAANRKRLQALSMRKEEEVVVVPMLEEFEFVEEAKGEVMVRWKSLNEQIARFKVAKERAIKAREEEKERRREKDKENARLMVEEAKKEVDRCSNDLCGHHHHSEGDSGVGTEEEEMGNNGKRGSTNSNNAAIRPPVQPVVTSLAPPPLPSTVVDAPLSAPTPPPPSPSTTSPLPPPLLRASNNKPPLKKGRKKRSAHANALNVHHRDNYVPSRIPTSSSLSSHHHQSPTTSSTNIHNSPSTTHHHPTDDPRPLLTSWPASPSLLASFPSSHDAPSSLSDYFSNSSEWLCTFCEYELIFGEPSLFAKGVGKRKKVLKVRREAREKARKKVGGGGGKDEGGAGGEEQGQEKGDGEGQEV